MRFRSSDISPSQLSQSQVTSTALSALAVNSSQFANVIETPLSSFNAPVSSVAIEPTSVSPELGDSSEVLGSAWFSSIQSPTEIVASQVTPGTAVTSIGVTSAVAQLTEQHPSSATLLRVGTPGVTPENYKGDWDVWTNEEPLEWIQITPAYAQTPSGEIRSRGSLLLTKTFDGVSKTLPSSYSQEVGNPIAVSNITESSGVLSFAQGAGTVVIPSNQNVETLYPSMAICYQTDNVTGPSEKVLVNVRRLRALGVQKFTVRYGGFWILKNDIPEVPIKVRLVTGGNPKVIDTGASPNQPSYQYRDWAYNGTYKFINDLELFLTTNTINSSTFYWLYLEVDLAKKTLHYVY